LEQKFWMQGCVNLTAYPLENLDSEEGRVLVERTCSDLKRTGVAALPSFLLPSALHQIVSDAEKICPIAYRSNNEHNIYLDDLLGQSEDEVRIREMQQKSSKTCITYDQIPRSSLISVRTL